MNGDQPPLFERLEVLDDPTPRSAALNMALDEVLLTNLGATPLLRIYRWEHPAISFGYFTPWKSLGRHMGADGVKIELVRRWTGGGIVEHGRDLTYSVFIPRTHPLSNGPAGQSYQLIHDALRSALRRTGQGKSHLAVDPPGPSAVAGQPCFANPVRHDLLSGSQKIGGGAQRRTRGGLLHQGSVLASLDLLKLAAALPAAFGRDHLLRRVQPDEIRAAEILAREKYAADAWLRRV